MGVIFTDHAADAKTVFSGHSFMGNGHVASDLGIQKFSDIRKLHCICEFPDILQIQQCAVCLFFFFLSLIRIKKDLLVLNDLCYIDMVIFDLQADAVFSCFHLNDNVKNNRRVKKFYFTDICIQKLFAAFPSFICHFGKYLHIKGSISCNCTKNNACRNSF